MKKEKPILSKSRLLRGLQCPKSLFLSVHRPDLEGPVSASQQAIFDQGHEVGILAQEQYAGGVLIDHQPYYDTVGAAEATAAAIHAGATTIYEATITAHHLAARVDILHRKSQGAPWQIIEVKSSTSVKPVYIDDVSIQLHVARLAGFEVTSASILYLNPQATAPSLEKLFIEQDVTEESRARTPHLIEAASKLQETLALPEPPTIDIGPHCHEPYECPFVEHCWEHVTSPSVFDLPAMGKQVWELYNRGVVHLDDKRIGPFEGTKGHRLEAARNKLRWVNAEGIRAALASWKWPLLYFDFETLSPAVPRYPGTRPYQQVPFQFSAMIQKEKFSPVDHFEFLCEDAGDPRPPLIAALLPLLEKNYDIVAYNKGFESARLKELAAQFPEHATTLLAATKRLVDPLPLFKENVYDFAFKDSFSIKSVAPAILGKPASYEGLAVPDGSAAQRAFSELIHEGTSATRREDLKTALLVYCKKDTQVMVDLVDWLAKQ